MTAIIDYGVGNLFSLKSSFAFIGEEAVVTNDKDIIDKSDRIILPGVGAFGDAAEKLRESGLDKVVKEQAAKGKPILGICLGMQLLFDKSYEYGEYEGLGLIKGSVKPIENVIDKGLKIPHIGWNGLIFPKNKEKSSIYKYTNEGDCVYFVHSYYLKAKHIEDVAATTDYIVPVHAAVEHDNIFACQFHPEKSSTLGLRILDNFAKM